jgi:inner membrane transporter RhtA
VHDPGASPPPPPQPLTPLAPLAPLAAADKVPAWLLALLAILSVQLGAALSTGLFGAVGPAGTVFLRMTAGAAILVALRRPRLRGRTRRELVYAVGLGATTGAMTVLFLEAVARLQLGTVVAIEFLGPLGVAVIGTRSLARLAWPVLGLLGVLLLTQPWSGRADAIGILLALGAGLGWGIYILLTARVGDRFAGIEGLSITIPIAAVVAAVFGLPQALAGHITIEVVLAAIGLALLQPIAVFGLEMLALRRITTSAFGTLMALEPGVALVVGGLLLAQLPSALQVVGIGLVVVAGVGAARGGGREPAGGHPHADLPA